MAIVSQESIDNLKRLRDSAKNSDNYRSGYSIAQQGLAAAIAQLEQIKMITSNFEVVLKETK
ncbi:hypothetical protein XbC2_432 [Xanthomonas phage XbC2]|nr:hypothetical protein XbC2_432 [Xanthomonas phage XbC2]